MKLTGINAGISISNDVRENDSLDFLNSLTWHSLANFLGRMTLEQTFVQIHSLGFGIIMYMLSCVCTQIK